MAAISGRVVFDRDRSATISAGDSGLVNIPVVLQNINVSLRLTVLTDSNGNYTFINVPNGQYRIVESYGTLGGVPSPGDFMVAEEGSIPAEANPPVSAAVDPPPGTTDLDSLTQDTILVTVSGADLTDQDFLDGPVIYTPVQTILDPCAIISGDNLIQAADGGTFGTFSTGTPANTGAPVEPYAGVTPDFTYVLPNPTEFKPYSGEYTVQNIMSNAMSNEIGAWWRIADHTTGNETGRMMIINGVNPGAVFFRDEVTVQPGTNYLFTAWILNLFRVTGYPDPELGVRIRDQSGSILYDAALGALIPVNVNVPEWRQIGSVINSQDNVRLTVEFLSEGPEAVGNDYVIDDISFREIMVPEFTPVKTVSTENADIGETVTYTVTLTNRCTSPLTGLLFQDTIPDGLSFVPGSVLINGITVSEADPNAGFTLPDVLGGKTVTVAFEAEVTAIPNPNPAISSASLRYFYTPVEGGIPGEIRVVSNEVSVEVGPLADISVIKTTGPGSVVPGNMLAYLITVSNAGPDAAKNVILYDAIPPELAEVQFSVNGGGEWNSWTDPYRIGTLLAGESRTIRIRGTVAETACGIVSNTAVVTSSTQDPDPANNTSSVNTLIETKADADLSVRKTACPNTAVRCRRLTYTITVCNAGPTTAQQVVVSDDLPEELKNPCYSLDNGWVRRPWSGSLDIGNLAPGASAMIKISGIVCECAKDCIKNTVVVSSQTPDPDLSNNTDTVILRVCDCCK